MSTESPMIQIIEGPFIGQFPKAFIADCIGAGEYVIITVDNEYSAVHACVDTNSYAFSHFRKNNE